MKVIKTVEQDGVKHDLVVTTIDKFPCSMCSMYSKTKGCINYTETSCYLAAYPEHNTKDNKQMVFTLTEEQQMEQILTDREIMEHLLAGGKVINTSTKYIYELEEDKLVYSTFERACEKFKSLQFKVGEGYDYVKYTPPKPWYGQIPAKGMLVAHNVSCNIYVAEGVKYISGQPYLDLAGISGQYSIYYYRPATQEEANTLIFKMETE